MIGIVYSLRLCLLHTKIVSLTHCFKIKLTTLMRYLTLACKHTLMCNKSNPIFLFLEPYILYITTIVSISLKIVRTVKNVNVLVSVGNMCNFY